MAKTVIIDTGFWFALYDPADAYHASAAEWAEILSDHEIVAPWPSLYEALNTRFVRRHPWLHLMELQIKKGLIRFDDAPYREQALVNLFQQVRSFHSWSLTDLVIREILADPSVRLDYLVTTNEKDFAEFDRVRGLELIGLASSAR